MKLKPGLYIVSTPIGNMGDITYRAVEVLRNSDRIFAEDTRITKKLLDKHQIDTKLAEYNDHSDEKVRSDILQLINDGLAISLVSDGGTPLISDPGYKLVQYLQEANCFIDVAPGVSSLIAALTLSGLPTDKFMFAGFLPRTSHAKCKVFESMANIEATLIFFETSNRLLQSLSDALHTFGDREISVARELTKIYQNVQRGNISTLISFFESNPPRGEVVLLISGTAVKKADVDIATEIKTLLTRGFSAKDVTAEILKKYPEHNKKVLYKMVNELKVDCKSSAIL